MPYEFNRDDAFAFADYFGAKYHEKGDELNFDFCPYCGGGSHGDRDTFSINLTTGAYHCLRASCGASGHFVELCRDFDYRLEYETPKIYRTIPQPSKPIKPNGEAVRYLQGRGISPEITTRFEITSLASKGKPNILFFPFYDDQGKLVFAKYRNTKPKPKHPKEWCKAETMPILFGMKQARSFDLPMVITEGQIDSLSVSEAGVENAVSVPTGANAIRKAVENAEVPPLENVKDLSTVRSVDLAALDKIQTGITELDQTIGGLVMGTVVLLTGKRGEGKSTFGSQLIANALDEKESVFAYSGELADFHFKRWLDLQLAGVDHVQTENGDFGTTYTISEEIVRKISDWYKGRAFIYDNEYLPNGQEEYESLCDTIEKVIKQYGTRLIFIDNLMTAMDAVFEQNNLYLAQSNFVGSLKKIAMRYQVVIVLVAHPRKSNTAFSNDDVSGSSDITNKVDVVMSYSRAEDPDAGYQSVLQVTKNRLWGKLRIGTDAIRLRYSEATKRVFNDKPEKPRVYGWEFEKIDVADFDLPFD